MDKILGPAKDPTQNSFGSAHFPKNIHVKSAFAAGNIMGYTRLGNAALDRIGQ